ncbi:MAG: hypothetical protein HPY76_08780 [Anaerolineae bacterium]|nr:hypothetical protein [Anaerolineae bacterium]
MIDPDDRTNRTRLILVAIIVGSLMCYCLGWVVLQGAERADNAPTATQTSTLTITTSPLEVLSPTPPFIIRTATVSPTPTVSWTPSRTFTQFVPPTSTRTQTPEPPTITPTMTETELPSDTPEPPTETPSLTPETVAPIEDTPTP